MRAIHPYCGDRKVLKGYNDLRTTHPKIVREWNKERNGDLKPTDVLASSNKRVWWKCKEGHEWSGLIANRVSVNIVFTIFANVFSPIAPTRFRRIRQRGCAAFGA